MDAEVRRLKRELESDPSAERLDRLDAARRRAGDGPWLPILESDAVASTALFRPGIQGWDFSGAYSGPTLSYGEASAIMARLITNLGSFFDSPDPAPDVIADPE